MHTGFLESHRRWIKGMAMTDGMSEGTVAKIVRLRSENYQLRTAAGTAASILSRHLSMQLSNAESWVELRKAREALVAALKTNP